MVGEAGGKFKTLPGAENPNRETRNPSGDGQGVFWVSRQGRPDSTFPRSARILRAVTEPLTWRTSKPPRIVLEVKGMHRARSPLASHGHTPSTCRVPVGPGGAWRWGAAAVLLAAMTLAGCQTKKTYRQPDAGWHSADFRTVLGRVRKTSDDPAVWLLRFGTPSEPYQGEFALTVPADAPNRLAGYTGGEMVEVKGHLLDKPTTDAYNGRWLVVDSIQMWVNYKQ